MGEIATARPKRLAALGGAYAVSLIIPLQSGLLGKNNGASARCRAELARLRKAGVNPSASFFLTGETIFERWPQEELDGLGASQFESDCVLRSVESSLNLYALHQQSEITPCAVVRREGETDEELGLRRRHASFGRACRQMEPDLSEAAGIQRRLRAIEGASDFAGVLYGMRQLVGLMKSSGKHATIPLDYWQLTYDLYLLQLAGTWRDSVLSRWSRDYFAPIEKKAQA